MLERIVRGSRILLPSLALMLASCASSITGYTYDPSLGVYTRDQCKRKEFQGEVTALNYNIQGLPIVTSKDWEGLGERLADVHGFRVVGLNEAFHLGVERMLGETDFCEIYTAPKTHMFEFGSGLVIATDGQIVETDRHEYTHSESWDAMVAKSVYYALIDLGPYKLNVYVTHLQSDPDMDPFYTIEQAEKVRESQITELGHFITHTKHPQYPTIVIGDFNTHPDYKSYDHLLAVLKLNQTNGQCLEPDCEVHFEAKNTKLDYQFHDFPQVAHVWYFTSPEKGGIFSDHPGVKGFYSKQPTIAPQ